MSTGYGLPPIKGMVGLIDHNTLKKIGHCKYEDSLLHFRALATTSACFLCSIANPAVLYKIDFDGEEATSIHDVYVERGEKVFYLLPWPLLE
ncbi:MAG: hypothetical protein R2793_10070 [Flavobacteriaceae bacterium]